MPAVPARFALLAVTWMILDGIHAAGLLIGLPAALLAAGISLRLFPSTGSRVRPAGLLVLGLRCLRDALSAGIDVAGHALRPGRMNPGCVTAPCSLRDDSRALLLALSGIAPGSMPAGDAADGEVILHCLDRTRPAAAELAALEAGVTRALGGAARA